MKRTMKLFTSYISPTVLLAFVLMLLILMMVVPIPAIILDIGLAASFSLAILIFTITLFVEKPLDFSAFPSVLLASLMLRLSLNISSTKLIIGEGHNGTHAAGEVIESFAEFIMGGNAFLGIIVFLVLLIVNFIVITKGATRMAEVGARFALDGMPGKQLAIDSDVAAGSLSHEEATARRKLEQQETTFFGSLDGASKFVKGDAIAGLLITLLNFCAGLIMGIFFQGMSIGTAFETYAMLTVGDGLVSQVPAVIISIASALLLARGGTVGATDVAIFEQMGRHASALFSVAFLLFLFALLPGLPFVPFTFGSTLLAGFGYWSLQHARKTTLEDVSTETEVEAPTTQNLGDLLEIDDLHVEFAPDLVNTVLDPGTGLDARVLNMRHHVARSFGVVLPEIRLSDQASLPSGGYSIRIQGVEQARGVLEPDKIMALLPDGRDDTDGAAVVSEPVYGAPAQWFPKENRDSEDLLGMTLVTPNEILATHLLEVIKRNLSRLMTLKTLKRVLRELSNLSDPIRAESNRKLIDDLIPDKVPMDTLHSVLRLLLDEQVSIRNLPLILEAIAEARLISTVPEAICEHVRCRLGFQIIGELKRDDGSVPLLQLSGDWERTFDSHQLNDAAGNSNIALPPEKFNQLAENIERKVKEVSESGIFPALATNAKWRRFLKTIMQSRKVRIPVVSFEEIGPEARPSLVGVIEP